VDLGAHPMAAEAVYAGLTAADGRARVEQLASGPPVEDIELLEEVTRQVVGELSGREEPLRLALMSSMVDGFLSAPRALDDSECARFAVLAGDIAVRDEAWVMMDREGIEDHVDLWTQVVARTVPPFVAAPLCLLGMAAWISGNGALQNCCSDRAARVDPGYTMAQLLGDINRRALAPRYWDLLAADLRRETRRSVGEGPWPVASPGVRLGL
jgi:hypothetical protein